MLAAEVFVDFYLRNGCLESEFGYRRRMMQDLGLTKGQLTTSKAYTVDAVCPYIANCYCQSAVFRIGTRLEYRPSFRPEELVDCELVTGLSLQYIMEACDKHLEGDNQRLLEIMTALLCASSCSHLHPRSLKKATFQSIKTLKFARTCTHKRDHSKLQAMFPLQFGRELFKASSYALGGHHGLVFVLAAIKERADRGYLDLMADFIRHLDFILYDQNACLVFPLPATNEAWIVCSTHCTNNTFNIEYPYSRKCTIFPLTEEACGMAKEVLQSTPRDQLVKGCMDKLLLTLERQISLGRLNRKGLQDAISAN